MTAKHSMTVETCELIQPLLVLNASALVLTGEVVLNDGAIRRRAELIYGPDSGLGGSHPRPGGICPPREPAGLITMRVVSDDELRFRVASGLFSRSTRNQISITFETSTAFSEAPGAGTPMDSLQVRMRHSLT